MKKLLAFFLLGLSMANAQNGPMTTTSYTYTYNEGPQAIVSNDFNNDGKKDLVISFYSYINFTTYMSVYLQTAGNSFNTYTLSGSGGFLTADVNNDNNNDIVGSNTYLGTGTGSFTTLGNNLGGLGLSTDLADFDNDGKLDVIGSYYNGSVVNNYFCKGLGNGSFTTSLTFTSSVYGEVIVPCNLDNNANKDLVLYTSPSSSQTVLRLFSGNGNGSFSSVGTVTLSGELANNPAVYYRESVKISDIDNDGKEDIAIAFANAGQFAILKGNGNFTFNAPVYSTVNYFPFALDDLNNDGIKDVMAVQPVYNTGYNIQTLFNNGSNSLVSPLSFSLNAAVGFWSSKIIREDFNNDNKKDFAVYTYSGNPSVDFLFANSGCVWPGDANSDGIANNIDILELGLHINQSGAPRASAGNAWASFTCVPWTGTTSTGANLFNSDCNGDGVINEADTAAIWLNYGLMHPRENAVESTTPQLTIVPDQPSVYKGTWGSASIYLGDVSSPVNAINGIAFTVNYDNILLQTDSVYVTYINSFVNSNNLRFSKKYFSNGKLHTATTHTLNQDVNGYGKVAVLHYKVKPTLAADSVLHLTLSAGAKMSAGGLLTPLSTGAGTLMASVLVNSLKSVSAEASFSLFPNPSGGIFSVRSGLNETFSVSVYNMLGEKVFSDHEGHSEKSYVLDLAPGVYFYIVESGIHAKTTGKLIIE